MIQMPLSATLKSLVKPLSVFLSRIEQLIRTSLGD